MESFSKETLVFQFVRGQYLSSDIDVIEKAELFDLKKSISDAKSTQFI